MGTGEGSSTTTPSLSNLDSRGTTYSFSNPDTPQQNGVAEAANKTILRIARTLLEHSQAPRNLWGYAILHATHLANLLPHHQLGEDSTGAVVRKEAQRVPPTSVGVYRARPTQQEREASKWRQVGPCHQTLCPWLGTIPSGLAGSSLDGDTLRECPSSDVAFQEHIPFFPVQGPEGRSPTWDHFDSLEHSRANPPPAPPSSQTLGTLGVPPPSTPQGDLSATSGGAGGAGAGP